MGSYSGNKENQMNQDEMQRQRDQYAVFQAYLQKLLAGGADPNSPMGQAQSGYSNFAQTGGFDPSSIPQVTGPDAATRNAIMGYGLFQKAAESGTGLMTPEQLQDLRSRQASANASTYSSLQDDLEQRNRAAGNLTPGVYSASLGKLARDKAHSIQSGTLDAETNIANMENQQRMWGASGGSQAGLGLGNLDFNVSNANAHNALTGAGLKQQGQEFGISGLSGLGNDWLKSWLASMGQEGQGQQSGINAAMGYNPKKSWWDTTFAPLLGAGASIGGTLLGRGGSKGNDPYSSLAAAGEYV